MPPADEVRDALQRIVTSDVFARSERARDLLRYLVEQDLDGNADRLKGFSIAVDVFGKGDRFDPSTDAVVRVQAGRLRDLLDQYYAAGGRNDALRIAIPRGSYVPEYKATRATAPAGHAAAAPTPSPQPSPSGSGARLWRHAAAAGGLLVLLLVVAAYRGLHPSAPAGSDFATATELASVEVEEQTGSVERRMLPAVHLQFDEDDPESERVAGALRRGLAGFDSIDFIARRPGTHDPETARRTDFLFLVEPGTIPGEVHIELHNIVSGKVLLSLNLAVAGRRQTDIDDDVADILTAAAPVSGAIYAHIVESGAQTALTRCLILNDHFYRNQSPQAHRAAYECLEKLTTAQAQSALIYSELASLHLQAVTGRYGFPVDASPQKALQLARTAVQLGPNSPFTHRAMGYVLARTIDAQESIRWMRKAYELNTFDLSMAASYGYALVFAGEYETGTPVLERAVAVASAHPPWWDYGLFLGQFMAADMKAAAKTVSALAAIERAHYVAARLIVADALDRRAAAAALLAELRGDYAEFAADPRGFFHRGNYPELLADRLVEALRAAGLTGES